ncbi:MAG: GAF domain-containing protein [Leptospiraceae bacterium]
MVAIGCFQSARPGPPVARDGVLDLRQWDFESNGSANLSGDWKLVWGQFASPNSPLRNAYDARVPRSWDHLGIEGVSGRGFGTLQLVLQGLPETTSGLTISLPSMTGAYRLYCGESLIAATGTAGNSYETTTPERIPRVAILPTECIKENQAVLTWHVANFRHRTGGGAAELTSTMTIGLPAQTMSSVYRRHLADLSLLAIAFIMALYHLVYWLFRRDDVQLVLFSAVAALFCVRITGTQTLLQQAFPSADFYEIEFMLEYLGYYLLVPVFFSYLRAWYPGEFNRFVSYTLWIIGGLFSATVLFGPVDFYSNYIRYYESVSLAAFLYTLIALGFAIVRKRRGAWILNAGVWIIIGTATHDILGNMGVLQSETYLAQFGFLTFLLSQSSLMAALFSDAFRRAEDLSENLEKKVVSRTGELAREKDRAETARATALAEQLESEILADLAQQANRGTDAKSLLDPLARVLTARLGADRLGLWVARDDGYLELVAGFADGQPTDPKQYSDVVARISTGEKGGILARGYREGRIIYVPRVNRKLLENSPVDREIQSTWKFDWFVNLPLVVDRGSVGMIAASGPRAKRIPRKEIRFLERAAATVASATQKQMLLERIEEEKDAAKKLERETRALAEFTRRLNERQDLNSIVSEVCQYSVNSMALRGAYVTVINEKEREFQSIGGYGLDYNDQQMAFVRSSRVPLSQESGLIYSTYRRKKNVHLRRLRQSSSPVDEYAREILQLNSIAHFPLLLEGNVIGVLAVDPGRRKLSQKDLGKLQNYADQVTGAINNAALLQQVQQQRMSIEGLARITETAASTDNLDEILNQIFHYVHSRFGILSGLVMVPNEDRTELQSIKVHTFEDKESLQLAAAGEYAEGLSVAINLQGGTLARTFLRGRPFYVPDVSRFMETGRNYPGSEIDRDIFQNLRYKGYLALPMTVNKEPVALLNFTSYGADLRLSRADREELGTLADQLAGIIRSRQLAENLSREKKRAEQEKAENEVLANLARRANEGAGIEDILIETSRITEAHCGVSRLGLYLVDTEKNTLELHSFLSSGEVNDERPVPDIIKSIPIEFESGSLAAVVQRMRKMFLPSIRPPFLEASPVDAAQVEFHKFDWFLQAPLMTGGSMIGVLAFVGSQDHRPGLRQRQLMGRIVDQIAGAVQSKQLLDQVEDARRDSEALAELARRADAGADLFEIGELVLDYARAKCGVDTLGLYTVNRELNRLEVQAFARKGPIEPGSVLPDELRFPPLFEQTGSLSQVVSRGRPLYMDRLPERLKRKMSDHDRKNLEFMQFDWFLDIPMIAQEEVIGVIAFAGPARQKLSESERNFLERITVQVSGSVKNRQLLKQVESERNVARTLQKETEGLNQLLKRIAPMEDLEEIMEEVMAFSKDAYDIGVYSLYSVDNERKQMQALAMNFPDHIGPEDRQYIMETPVPLDFRGGAFTIAYRRSPRYTYFKNAKQEGTSPIEEFVSKKYDLTNMVVYPLMEGDQVMVFLNFLTYNKEGLNRDQLSQLSILSDQISGIIRMNGLIREVKEQSVRTEAARKETDMLAELSRKANEATDLEAVSQTLFDHLRESLELDDFCLFVLEPETRLLHAAAWDTSAAEDPETRRWLETTHHKLEPDVGTLYRTYSKKKTTYLPRFPEAFFAPGDRIIVEKLKLTSALQVPLLIQDEVIGFLTSGPRRRLTREEITSVERFCNQVAGAIRATALLNSTAQARQRAENARRETEALAVLSREANETVNLENLSQTVFHLMRQTLDLENFTLFIVDDQDSELLPAKWDTVQDVSEWKRNFRVPLQPDAGTLHRTWSRKRTLYLPAFPEEFGGWADQEIVGNLKIESVLQIPLVVSDRVVGIFACGPTRKLNREEIRSAERYIQQIAGAVRIIALLQATQEAREEAEVAKEEAEVARAESDALLENVLPSVTAKELKESGRVEPVYFDNVSVMFTDFVGFTKAAARLTPAELIQELDGCFSQFDEVSRRNNLEKLKTIGDAYMCAGGLPVPNEGHAIDACLTALEFRSFMNQMAAVKGQLGYEFWQIRIGIHSGPVTAGVIGQNKFSYDIWGDTVNVASRMESSGSPGMVNISGATYELVKDLFQCEYRGKVQAKGKGELDMYFVHRIKPELSADEGGLLPNAMFELARTDMDMDEINAMKSEIHENHAASRYPDKSEPDTGSTQAQNNTSTGKSKASSGDQKADRRAGSERRKHAGARPLSELDKERQGW